MEAGDLDSAAHTFERLREAWRSAGFRNSEAIAAVQLGDIEFRRGLYQRAAELFLSPRTVEHHIEAIFNKLGIGSRVELVAA